jgi:CMP-N-acetylneuraminic acid synthetase
MYKGKKILATICARGGSKGVKNKNIRLLDNIPLIGYSLQIIKAHPYIDDYVISTDSPEIISVVKELGFKIEFIRPDALSGDDVGRIDAIQHAYNWKKETGKINFDYIVDLGVATPLKNSTDLSKVIELCVDTGAQNVFSVCESIKNPYFNMVEVQNNKVKLVKEFYEITSRQTAPKVYEMNDGFNVWTPDALFSDTPQFQDSTQMLIMPRERSVDIDEEEDFLIAQIIKSKQN